MDLQTAPSNVHHRTFFSLPRAFLSMQAIKYAYACVHMNLRVIRFSMQMPCEYWCFPGDDPGFSGLLSFFWLLLFLVPLIKLSFILASSTAIVTQVRRPRCTDVNDLSVFLQNVPPSEGSTLNP